MAEPKQISEFPTAGAPSATDWLLIQQAAPDMLHRHVIPINAALETARPHPMPEAPGEPLC